MKKHLGNILTRRLWWLYLIPLVTIATAPVPAYAQDEAADDIVTLSPFSILADEDEGYMATQTLAGTRVRADIKDLGASISLLTEEFMNDIAANDLMELLPYVGQTEVGGLFGNFSGEGNTNFFGQNRPTTFLRQHPHTQTRIRGLQSADLTRDYSLTDVPLDGYVVDRVAVQRGANSMLFGLGSPAGLINSQILTARMDRDQFKGTITSDNYGTLRATLDVNKVLWEDKLAVRVATLYEDQEFVQEPTYERDRRIFTTVTYKPLEHTTIKASFEAGKIRSNRPDIMAPMNLMSQNWFDAGMPAATALQYEADRQPDHPLSTGPFWGHITAPYEVYASSSDVANGQFNGVGLMQRRNISQIECWTAAANQANPNADGTLPGLPDAGTRGTSCYELNTDGTKATNTAGKFIPIVDPVGPVMFMTTGGFHPQNIGGGKQSNDASATFCDPTLQGYPNNGGPLCHSRSQEESFSLSDMDWVHYDKYKFHSPELGEQDFSVIDLAVQHSFLNEIPGMSAAVEFVWHKEDHNANFMDGQWDGLISGMFVDVNPILSDGRTNPNFRRPAVANFRPENQHNNFEREAKRFTAHFSVDFTNNEGATRFLGRHSITGLYNDQYNYKFHGEGFTRTVPAPVNMDHVDAWFGSVGATGHQLGAEHGYICYVGPPIAAGTKRNMVVINDTCPESALPLRGSDFKFTAWDRFAASEHTLGQQWTDISGQVTAWRHRKVNVSLENAKSIVFIDHSHWFDGNLVSTLGWRQDEVFLENFPGDRDDLSLHRPNSWHTTHAAGNAKTTIFSWGLVGHVPSEWMPDGVSLSGHYSKSENFLPAAGRTDAEGLPQDSPGGNTQEYGVSLGVLNDKVRVKFNWYESALANAAVSTAIGHNENFGSSLIFGPAIGWLGEAGKQNDDGDPYGIAAVMVAQHAKFIATASATHQKAWSWERPSTYVGNEGDPANTVQVADTIAKGLEFEMVGSPIKGLNIGINASQQQVVQTNIAKRFIALWERERPELEAIKIDSVNGFTYNSTQYGLPTPVEYVRIEKELFLIAAGGTAAAPIQQAGYQTQIDSLASRVEQVKRTDGQVSLEVREWRFNVFATYAFQGDGWLEGFGVGGAIRWQDEVALDYNSEIFVDSTGKELLVANLDDPITDSPQTQADVWVNYRRNLFNMDWTFRLNVRNAIRGDAAVAAIGQPDYSKSNIAMYRIVQPTTYIFSAAFAF